MQILPQTDEMIEAAARLRHLQRSGRLYDRPGVPCEGPEAVEAVAKLAAVVEPALRRSLQDAHPELVTDEGAPPTTQVLHNGSLIIETPVGGGFCAVGIYNWDTMTCYYYGVAKCRRLER